MNSIARATPDERKTLFSNASVKIGLSPGIVEKDFWVVWTLETAGTPRKPDFSVLS